MAEAGRATRKLAEEFRHASDNKILKITQMIDRMPERGEADALLDPIRDRLAALRPTRRMTWTRLLFVPFDPVLVPASRWRPGQFTLPRSVLMPVVELLDWSAERRVGSPPLADDAGEAELLRVAGPVWMAAAARLATTELPDGWHEPGWQKETGLTRDALGTMLPAIRLVLAHAETIRSLARRTGPELVDTLGRLLGAALAAGGFAWGLMLTLLFAAVSADEVARVAVGLVRGGRADPALLGGLDQAIGTMLDRLETRPAESGHVGERLSLINRVEGLQKLEHRPPEELRRIRQLRAGLAEDNRDMFGRMLDARLPADGHVGPAEGEMTDDAVLALEAGMRQLREFALAASRLGDAAEYERLLERAAARCEMRDGPGGLSAVDRLRLVELLVGGERALRPCGVR